jgi:hypothetical protein
MSKAERSARESSLPIERRILGVATRFALRQGFNDGLVIPDSGNVASALRTTTATVMDAYPNRSELRQQVALLVVQRAFALPQSHHRARLTHIKERPIPPEELCDKRIAHAGALIQYVCAAELGLERQRNGLRRGVGLILARWPNAALYDDEAARRDAVAARAVELTARRQRFLVEEYTAAHAVSDCTIRNNATYEDLVEAADGVVQMIAGTEPIYARPESHAAYFGVLSDQFTQPQA